MSNTPGVGNGATNDASTEAENNNENNNENKTTDLDGANEGDEGAASSSQRETGELIQEITQKPENPDISPAVADEAEENEAEVNEANEKSTVESEMTESEASRELPRTGANSIITLLTGLSMAGVGLRILKKN